jgi:hypothetical protein
MSNPTDSAGGKVGVVERLVFTESTDGLPLEGAVLSPDRAERDVAIVWIHGSASKFCERHYIAPGRKFAALGYVFLTGNTRGHDGFSIFWRGDDVVPGEVLSNGSRNLLETYPPGWTSRCESRARKCLPVTAWELQRSPTIRRLSRTSESGHL